jgi:hypothetical protein
MMATSQPKRSDAWEAARRWREREVETRVNFVRIAAVGSFYLIHLLQQWAASSRSELLVSLGLGGSEALDQRLHLAVTCLVIAWTVLALLVHVTNRELKRPMWLATLSTAVDLMLLTGMLLLSSGAASPLVAGYFLIIMLAGLRLNLQLVRLTTIGAIVSYLVVLGCTRWPQGMLIENELPRVPRFQQLMTLVALLLSGVIIGQWTRHSRRLAEDIARAAKQGLDV